MNTEELDRRDRETPGKPHRNPEGALCPAPNLPLDGEVDVLVPEAPPEHLPSLATRCSDGSSLSPPTTGTRGRGPAAGALLCVTAALCLNQKGRHELRTCII